MRVIFHEQNVIKSIMNLLSHIAEEFQSKLLFVIRRIVIDSNKDPIELKRIFKELFNASNLLKDDIQRELVFILNRNDMKRLLEKMVLDNQYRSYLDTTLRQVLNFPEKGPVTWTTWIHPFIGSRFLEFIQGITMFASRGNTPNSVIGNPAYHRLTSCGHWTKGQNPKISEDYENKNLKCDPTLGKDELERRRRNIWTCLIERLIYGQLYEFYVGVQDSKHLINELHVTRSLFESCFAITNIYIENVKVFFNKTQLVPESVIITYKTPKHKVTETYTREYTGSNYTLSVDVICKKEVAPASGYPRNGPGDVYAKTQSYFSAPTNWLPISPGAPPLQSGGRKKKNEWTPNCIVVDPWTLN